MDYSVALFREVMTGELT